MCECFDTLNHDSDGRGGCSRFWAAADDLMRGLHKFQLEPRATKALIKLTAPRVLYELTEEGGISTV